MRRLRIIPTICAGLVVTLAAGIAACGPDQPSVRMRAQLGRELVYEARRVDDFPDPEFGHGGVLETAVRFRLTTTDAVSARGGKYETQVEAVEVRSAPRFGVRIDTDTPEPEGDDPMGVEELARRLIGRHGAVTIHESGEFGEIRPDPDLRSELKAWADAKPGPDALRVAALLDQMVDGPRVALRTLESPALLLPSEPYPLEGTTWTRATPTPSPAGLLVCAIDVSHERQGDGVLRLLGEGEFTCTQPMPDAKLEFVSGTFTAEAHFDAARGVFVSYDESSEMTFRKVADGADVVATWTRELKLVE
jgi:hypothetical protein